MIRMMAVVAVLSAGGVHAADYTYKPSPAPAVTAALQTPRAPAPTSYAQIARQDDGQPATPTLIPGGSRPVGPDRYVTETYGTSHGQNCGVPDCSNVRDGDRDSGADGLSQAAQDTYAKYHGGKRYHPH